VNPIRNYSGPGVALPAGAVPQRSGPAPLPIDLKRERPYQAAEPPGAQIPLTYIRCATIPIVEDSIEFDWDTENTRHLAAHKVAPAEAEQVLNSEPLDLVFEMIGNEERYRSVGVTNRGRLLTVAWTIRDGRIRVITAFRATVADRNAYLEKPK